MRASLVQGLGVQTRGDRFFQILVLPLPSSVILGKLLDLWVAQLPYL